MTRSIRVQVNAKNAALLIVALTLFAVVVAAGVGFFNDRAGPAAPAQAEHGQQARGGHEEEGHQEQEGHVELAPAALKNADLEILTAGAGDVNVTLSLPGEVSLNQEALAHVTPRVAGAAREVKKQLGELVKKGDVLAIIDSRDLAEVQREFLAAKERLALAQATMERAELLKRENISAEKDYLSARQALAEAGIEHRSAAQKLQAIGGLAEGGGYALVAPLAGTIIEKHINVGEVLSQETRTFTIADLSTIWVNVTVYARDLPRIAAGQAVEVRAEGIAEPAQGSIAYLGQVVGEQTRSATARIVLKNPGPAWRPGLFVTAEVVVERGPAAVVIDDAAVQSIEGKEVVFIQEGDGFDARPVRLGRKGRSSAPGAGEIIEVIEGVKVGDRYVSKNSFTLKAELGKSEAGHEH